VTAGTRLAPARPFVGPLQPSLGQLWRYIIGFHFIAATGPFRLRYFIASALLALITACSGLQYDLPPVSQAADGQRRPGKFIWHDLVSDDVAGSEAFYSELLGWEFRKLPLVGADYWLISLEGRPIGGMVEQRQAGPRAVVSQWVSVMSVDDAAAANVRAQGLGATVLTAPVSLGSRGTLAVYQDPGGAVFATLQTPDGDAPDRNTLPAEGDFLWHELWSADVASLSRFYADLSAMESEMRPSLSATGETVDFRILRADGTPRAGIRTLPADDMPSLWMPYLRIASRENLDALLARVPALGGDVLVPAVPRAVGGFVAVIAGPSGAPVALQTWSDDQPLVENL